jgi:hypothetical protein
MLHCRGAFSCLLLQQTAEAVLQTFAGTPDEAPQDLSAAVEFNLQGAQ